MREEREGPYFACAFGVEWGKGGRRYQGVKEGGK